MPRVPCTHLSIEGFADAVAVAFGLADAFDRAQAAAVLDSQGVVIDLTAFTGENDTVDDALWWADCFLLNKSHATKMVLLSTGCADVTVREAEVELFHAAREQFGARGVEVLDWLQVDTDDNTNIRSLAFTCGLESWDEPG